MTNQAISVNDQAQPIARFMGWPQWASLQSLMSGSEESEFFQGVAADLAQRIEAMPVIGGQEDSDAAQTVYLHYFLGASDVWVLEKDVGGQIDIAQFGHLEKDVGGGVEQVFAFALLNADYQMAELGYVDLSELLLLGFELDFHFSPKPLAEVRESVRKRLGLF